MSDTGVPGTRSRMAALSLGEFRPRTTASEWSRQGEFGDRDGFQNWPRRSFRAAGGYADRHRWRSQRHVSWRVRISRHRRAPAAARRVVETTARDVWYAALRRRLPHNEIGRA